MNVGMRIVGCVAAGLALAGCVAGCGESHPPPATLAVQSYLTDLAEGNYQGACGLIDGRTRRSLVHLGGARSRTSRRRVSCPAVFSRCLPDTTRVAKHDQSQLLFASVQVSINGERAAAVVSGTPVAEAVKQVTVAKEGRQWKLTSAGQALAGCRRRRS